MTLVFVDDARASEFAPFSLTRPVCELRAGAELVRRRWEIALGAQTTGFLGAEHLADFDEPGAASAVTGRVPSGSVLVNARCAVSLAPASSGAGAWTCEGRLAAVRVTSAVDSQAGSAIWEAAEGMARDTVSVTEVKGRWLDNVWDLVRHLPEMLAEDIPTLASVTALGAPEGVARLGDHPVLVERGASFEPFVVVDATAGPVLVRRGALVHSFSRLVGPCMIGEDVVVNGGKVAASSIGDRSRVCGEVSNTIFTGLANKAHDGFLGHSVLGRWVNLGASTVCSNLKNNYSDVAVWTPAGIRKTGMQFLGTMFGDHSKTAIGTRLTTGGVVGAGANVLDAGLTPKYIPPFAWGSDDRTRWELEPFLQTAERVMGRRDLPLSEKARRQLTAAWELAMGDAG